MDHHPDLPRHPVLACADRVHAAVDTTTHTGPVPMSTPEKAEALLELTRATERLHGLLLRVLAAATDIADDAGARTPAEPEPPEHPPAHAVEPQATRHAATALLAEGVSARCGILTTDRRCRRTAPGLSRCSLRLCLRSPPL